jgi:hypothetical protein
MRVDLRFLLPLLALVPQTGCNLFRQCADYETMAAGGPTNNPTAGRDVAEADIVQLDEAQHRIYAISRSGSLSVVDAVKPDALTLLGKSALSGVPFEMYRRGDVLLTMSNQAVMPSGQLVEAGKDVTFDLKNSAAIAAVDVRDPANIKTLTTWKVPGEIADSRIIGNILYITTYRVPNCYGCGTEGKTFITSFDVSAPSDPKQVDQIEFAPSSAPNYWSWAPWKRSIFANGNRIYVGGLAAKNTVDPLKEGIIEVIDVSDPGGHMKRGASLATSGPVMSRWQMDEHNGVLRVLTQHGAGRTTNGEMTPELQTFTVESATAIKPLGFLRLKLPRLEGLKTVRFDGPRAYAITFNQTDPLFTFDLANPATPLQKGELEIPGWVYHLEPRGNRLVGLGLDRTNKLGNLNVSLFDVTDLSKPTLLDRVHFGPTDGWSDTTITEQMMAEDQDRIQKAFRVFDDGLIAVPFSAPTWRSCATAGSGIQLINLYDARLYKHAMLPMLGNPRRALRQDQHLIGVSDSNVTAFDISNRSLADKKSDVVIGTCAPRINNTGWGMSEDWEGGECY